MPSFAFRTDPVAPQALQGLAQLGALLQRAASLWSAWQRMQFARACQRALLQLDERTLRDIGVDRSEIRSLAAEPEASRLWSRLGRTA
jgi:uncharacterized protein YjiS (DUF1127 family)